MEEIGKILPAVFKNDVRRADPRVLEILGPLWSRAAGKEIARHTLPVAFGAGMLTVATPCSEWAAQLRGMTEEIRAEINNYLGRPVVRKLRIRLAPEFGHPAPPATAPPALPESRGEDWAPAAGLDPEIAGIVERSFRKYFSRPPRRED